MYNFEYVIKVMPDWFVYLLAVLLVALILLVFVSIIDVIVGWFRDDE